mgnify:CR=1 FL=1
MPYYHKTLIKLIHYCLLISLIKLDKVMIIKLGIKTINIPDKNIIKDSIIPTTVIKSYTIYNNSTKINAKTIK